MNRQACDERQSAPEQRSARRITIARPTGYPVTFNTPRRSRHKIVSRRWLPFHKFWTPLEVALLMRSSGADLIATFNRIPLGSTPFVISFESHLPRLFGYEGSRAFQHFTRVLCSDRCRAILPISHFARRTFAKQHEGSGSLLELEAKLCDVVYPSVEIPQVLPRQTPDLRPLKVAFVGSHFARKGGVALLLAAEASHRKRLPLEVHIVSSLVVGSQNGVWTDPPEALFFDKYRHLLSLPNVQMHGPLDNERVLELVRSCDIGVLPTLCDTFGYTVLEFFAAGLMVIGTRMMALPEIIDDDVNGFLLDIETDANGEWVHLFSQPTGAAGYRRVWDATMASLSDQLLSIFTSLADDPSKVQRMQAAARASARERFDARVQSAVLDDLYVAALERPSPKPHSSGATGDVD